MDGVDSDNLTIEQYLRLTQESQTPKRIEDMTMAEYLKYEKKVNKNHINNTKSYLPTYFGKSTLTHDPIQEFAHYFGPNQLGVEFDCDSKDMEEEVEYMTNDEVVMSEKEESNHGYTQNIQHFEEKDDVDKWLNAEITKHISMQGVENIKDALISIINNKVDNADDNTSNTAPCRLPKELSSGSFLLPFNINNHNFYATTTLDAKDNIMPQRVCEYLGLDNLREEETFNPLEIGINLFSYESPACLEFEQKTRSHGTPKPQDEIAGLDYLSPDRRGLVKRWHVCKPIHVTYDDGSGEYCGMWQTCDPHSKFCFGYNEVFRVNEQGTLRQWICFCDNERRAVKGSYIGFADFLQGHQEHEPQPIRPRLCNYSFEEWLKIRIGHNNLHESDREFIFNEWILDSYDVKREYAREIGNPYSRRFDEYNRVFNNEIEHLSNEYILRIGKKGYVLDDVWEKCQQNYKKTNETWHDEGYEEDEMWQIRDEKTNYEIYDPPMLTLKLLK
ncbi:hypothetical protein Tco_0628572 [Tanacetum coccineum]|uniref:Uncharacterized protein n=1 Tax=Tanacetum coccineum TaxID=301880 RepID=A0ABQ4WQP5_9ASTR